MSTKNDEGASASLNELFEMLSNEHRRRILVAVARANPQDEDDIKSKSIASGHEGDDDAIELLEQRIYHVHLPKVDEAEFIDWDRESGLVRRGPRFEEIEPLLRLMNDHRDELPDA